LYLLKLKLCQLDSRVSNALESRFKKHKKPHVVVHTAANVLATTLQRQRHGATATML